MLLVACCDAMCFAVPQPPPLQPRRLRPLPSAPELLSAACGRVLGWARQRVRDDAGLEKLLHEAAVVSAHACYVCEDKGVGAGLLSVCFGSWQRSVRHL